VDTLNAKTDDGMEASNEKFQGNVAVRTRTVKVDGDASDGIALGLEPHSLTTVRCLVQR
jgi:hypothetical protein